MEKKSLQVRTNGKAIATIKRKLYARMVGNFNPIYARYNGKTYLVKSDNGDVSDPYRREESYKLHIDTEKACDFNI